MTRPGVDPVLVLARVGEYRDSINSQADQLERIAARMGQPEVAFDGVRMLRLFATDLTTLLDGGELDMFVITGTLP
jgi:hypothetical protein